MRQLCAGFARVNITPPMGMPIAGYYQVRLADKVLDELEANAVAVAAGEERLLLVSVDILELLSPYGDTDTTVPKPMIDMYKAFTGYVGWKNLGVITAHGCMDPGDIEGHKALEQAEALGRNL